MDLLIQNKHKMILSRYRLLFENDLYCVRHAQYLRKYRQNHMDILALLTDLRIYDIIYINLMPTQSDI